MKYNGYLKLDIANLEQRIAEGYIRRNAHPVRPISLYNYAEKAQYGNVWDNEILNSRGLVLHNDTHEPVNGVFPKFFNASPETIPTGLAIVSITEKMDGSFISLFNYGYSEGKSYGHWLTTTRGSFDSEQAQWALQFAIKNFDLQHLDPEWSYMFEAIYPENRVVVNYGERKDLVLLGARHIASGRFMTRAGLNELADDMGFNQPKLFKFGSVGEIFAAAKEIAASQEGWVVEYADDSRLKFKGEAYVLAHRVMTNVTFKRVLEAIALNKLDEMIEGVPDEFLDTVKAYRKEIEDKVDVIKTRIKLMMEQAPVQGVTQPEKEYRKQFAQWAFSHKAGLNPHYLLQSTNESQIESMIYKYEFEERLKRDVLSEEQEAIDNVVDL